MGLLLDCMVCVFELLVTVRTCLYDGWQNLEVLRKMGKYTGITSEIAVPVGIDSRDNLPINKRAPVSAQVIIGTPGTIKKWMSLRKLGVSKVKILVFDEADHMLAEVL